MKGPMNARAVKTLFAGLALVVLAAVSFGPPARVDADFSVSAARALEVLALSAVFLFAIPALYTVLIEKARLGSVGFRLPDMNATVPASMVAACAGLVLFAALLAVREEFQRFYGLGGFSPGEFVVGAVVLPAAYYAVEEFFFRGFLLWRLVRATGAVWGVVALNVLFAAVHITKPPLEILFSFAAGLVLSWLAYRTESFIPAAAVHFALALLVTAIATALGGAAGHMRF